MLKLPNHQKTTSEIWAKSGQTEGNLTHFGAYLG